MSDGSPQIFDSPLPPLFTKWMKDFLPRDIPAETAAPCLNCVMRPQPGSLLTADDISFSEPVKCCTYIPKLPNFLVGCILADEAITPAAGRSSTEARLQRGIGVSPFGLERTAQERDKFEDMIKGDRFGRDHDFRCPHFLEQNSGICGIWQYRNAVCATWFCRYLRGAIGAQFWRTIRLLLTAAEVALARWCVHHLDLGYEGLSHLYEAKNSGAVGVEDPTEDESMRRQSWGSWWGREREFYIKCSRLIQALTASDVMEIGGIELRTLAGVAAHEFQQLMEPTIPATLRFGDFSATSLDGSRVRVWGACRYQWIDLSPQFLQAPLLVEEGPTAEVLANIQTQTGFEMPQELLRQLLDLGILLPGLESDEPKQKNSSEGP